MSQSAVRAALELRLQSWATANALQVAWFNTDFTAPDATYVRPYILPAPTTSDDLQGLHRAYRGIFQVDIVIKRDTGIGAAEALVNSLDAQFPVNLRLTQSGVTVQILTPASPSRPMQEADRLVVHVSFSYRADA